MSKYSSLNIVSNLTVYGTAHGLVDAACAATIFSIAKNQLVDSQYLVFLVVLYNLLAFGTQAWFGLIVDYFKSPRFSAVVGCFLVTFSILVYLNFPFIAVVLAGIGNSLFHIGGGSISLNLTPRKASAPGIFVAPGALGLFIGAFLAKNGNFIAWHFIGAFIVLCFLMIVIKKPKMNYKRENLKRKMVFFEVILILVLLSITIRSLVGFIVVFPWKSNINLLISLTIAVVLGKGIGGVFADKFGWNKIAVGALLLSIPLLSFASNYPWLAIPGMFLFNITMPVTLVAISNLFPGRPAFAFGLTCLALILGAFPTLLNINLGLSRPILIFGIIFISTTSLFSGLQLLLNNKVLYDDRKKQVF